MLPSKRTKAGRILDILETVHGDARTYLDYNSPLQLLIATILSAQCTDERVNMVTPALFETFPTAKDIAEAAREAIVELVRTTGFFQRKAKAVQECCEALVSKHHGEVPDTLEELTALPGVGRKTANVVLANAFGRQAIAVDTHVQRVSTRLGLAEGKDADKIESQFCNVIPEQRWTRATHLLGTHGRRVCVARKPRCPECPVKHLCDHYRNQTV